MEPWVKVCGWEETQQHGNQQVAEWGPRGWSVWFARSGVAPGRGGGLAH
jgi:hypothetical protein